QIEQRMDLGDRTVDAPAGAHLAPMQDILLHDRCQLHRLIPLFLFRQKYTTEPAICQTTTAETPPAGDCPDAGRGKPPSPAAAAARQVRRQAPCPPRARCGQGRRGPAPTSTSTTTRARRPASPASPATTESRIDGPLARMCDG